jgi:hypothetical protein
MLFIINILEHEFSPQKFVHSWIIVTLLTMMLKLIGSMANHKTYWHRTGTADIAHARHK